MKLPFFRFTSGSDGLIKLWTVKTNECVKTLDAHEDKIWALAVNKDEETVISGAGDSTIIVWKVAYIIIIGFLQANHNYQIKFFRY